MKEATFWCADQLGVNAALRGANRNNLVILCYHSILPASKVCGYCEATVTAEQFRRQAEIIRRHYTPVSPVEVLRWVNGESYLPDRPIMISVDDGFRNNLEYAIPELFEKNIPALISVTTGYVGTRRILWTQKLKEGIMLWPFTSLPLPGGKNLTTLPDNHGERCLVARGIVESCKLIPEKARNDYVNEISSWIPPGDFRHIENAHSFLSWNDIRDIQKKGFTIGSHGVEHVAFSALGLAELETELSASKTKIEEETDAPCDWVTYPFGGYKHISETVVSEARKTGYKAGLALFDTGKAIPSSPLLLDRVFVSGFESNSVFLGRISGFHSITSSLKRTLLGERPC